MHSTSSGSTLWSTRSKPRKPRQSQIKLLQLSDELLLLIIQQLDRHDGLPNLRLTCKKLRYMSEPYMFRNVALTLEESYPSRWDSKLNTIPPQILNIRHLSFLNRCQSYHGGPFCQETVTAQGTYRLLRWELLEEYSEDASYVIKESGLFKGSLFYWTIKIPDHQLKSYRHRLAVAATLDLLEMIISRQANSLTDLELSMLVAPSDEEIKNFIATLDRPSLRHKLQSFTYRGLSYTEPLPVNGRNPEGRFRAIRPLFRKNHTSIKQLRLSQEHCISQIGKTPFINGHTYDTSLCKMEELYHSPIPKLEDVRPWIDLDLEVLELGGFQASKIIPSQNNQLQGLVTVQVPSLRRLVLEDCDGVDELLDKLTMRKDELQLREFAIRVEENDERMRHGDRVAASLKQFLLSFKGLETLSVLWKGDSLSEMEGGLPVQEGALNHEQTLKVYVFDERYTDDEDESEYRYTNIPKCNTLNSLSKIGVNTCQSLAEIGLTLTASDVADKEFPVLKLLSGFRHLQTVHIRTLPPIQTLGKDENTKFWRDNDGAVVPCATSIAEKFANSISVPFFTLPEAYETAKLRDSDLVKQLQAVLEAHRERRVRNLHGSIRFSDIVTSSTPLKNPADRVLKGMAKHDERLKQVLKAVKSGHATLQETIEYEQAITQIKWALGFTTDLPKPPLQLLVIGDWRYRDQMNITGPRSWDPQVWCVEKKEKETRKDSENVDEEDDLSSDEELGTRYTLRSKFKKQWDTALMPIFFKIDWEQKKNEATARYYWQAKATYLRQTSLEGYGALSHVKCLDFAWQD